MRSCTAVPRARRSTVRAGLRRPTACAAMIGRMDAWPVVSWIDGVGGVAHSSTLRRHRFTDHQVRTAVAGGALQRVRRSWLVTQGCDPRRRAAAEAGGRLTCGTAAEMRGLWTAADTEDRRIHVSVLPTASRIPGVGTVIHWARGPVELPPGETEEHLLNILFHVASCLPRGDALAVWEGALRQGLVDPEVLARVAWGATRPREFARIASQLSDSGLESQFVDLLRGAGIHVRQQVWIDGHPVDGLIGERLVVQIDGFSHHRAADRRRDLRADARLALLGYTVLRFDYVQVLFEPHDVLETIRIALAQRRHR
jgi:very-short-patch-repair endonuclease